MSKEKRSIFNNIFGKWAGKKDTNNVYLQMLNGYSPTFTSFASEDIANSIFAKTAINTIATHAAKLMPKHIQKANGEVKYINGNIYKMLTLNPNPVNTTYDFLYKIVFNLYKTNNSFVFIKKDEEGMIEGFYPITAGEYTLLEDKEDNVYLKFNFVNGKQYILPYTEIIHIKRYYNENDVYGDDNKILAKSLGVADTALQGIDNAIKISSYLRGILKITQNMIKNKDLLEYRDNFVKDFINIENQSGIAALDAKADFIPIDIKPITLDKDQLEYTTRNIYNYFGINEKIIQNNFTEEEWAAFFEGVIEPLAIQLSQMFTTRIFSDEALKAGHRIEFSTNRVKYASTKTKISLLKELGILGLYTVDEGREILDMSPIGGKEGKKRIQTLNVINADLADKYQGGKKKNDDSEGDDKDGK